jgi:hypothetical protein
MTAVEMKPVCVMLGCGSGAQGTPRESADWYTSGVPASVLIGTVFSSIYSFAQNTPQMCFICSMLILTAWFTDNSVVCAEQPPLTNCPRKSNEVQRGTAKQAALQQ